MWNSQLTKLGVLRWPEDCHHSPWLKLIPKSSFHATLEYASSLPWTVLGQDLASRFFKYMTYPFSPIHCSRPPHTHTSCGTTPSHKPLIFLSLIFEEWGYRDALSKFCLQEPLFDQSLTPFGFSKLRVTVSQPRTFQLSIWLTAPQALPAAEKEASRMGARSASNIFLFLLCWE